MRNLWVTLALSLLLFAPLARAQTPAILALGDSLTAGYGLAEGEGLVPQLNAWLAAQGTDAVVLNGGVSGDTSAGGLSRLDWALTPEVKAMIVTLGGNDLLRGLPPASTRANIDAILTQAKERGLPTLLISMKAPGNFGPDYKRDFDALYPDLAAQYGAIYLDNYLSPLADATGQALTPAYMQADGIHPNAEGVKRIVERLGPSVQALLAEVAP